MVFRQEEYSIKFEWGLKGCEELLSVSDVIIIIDVLSFSTAVSIAASRGAIVYPYKWNKEGLESFAKEKGAIIASRRGNEGISLSPVSLQNLNNGDKIILPSPNGSTISLATGDLPTFAGCIRNAASVAKTAMKIGQNVSVIACGEHWSDNSTLRPSIEDLLGAGAILSYLKGTFSPEAEITRVVFEKYKNSLDRLLMLSSSGKELNEKGFIDDVQISSQLNGDKNAPLLVDGAYQSYFNE